MCISNLNRLTKRVLHTVLVCDELERTSSDTLLYYTFPRQSCVRTWYVESLSWSSGIPDGENRTMPYRRWSVTPAPVSHPVCLTGVHAERSVSTSVMAGVSKLFDKWPTWLINSTLVGGTIENGFHWKYKRPIYKSRLISHKMGNKLLYTIKLISIHYRKLWVSDQIPASYWGGTGF
jgi:hypothetical protein